jgi:hypothetical protein
MDLENKILKENKTKISKLSQLVGYISLSLLTGCATINNSNSTKDGIVLRKGDNFKNYTVRSLYCQKIGGKTHYELVFRDPSYNDLNVKLDEKGKGTITLNSK